ncbi:MAG: hypothetical protein ACFCUT_06370 [Kiloniellaceae bacterium]
MPDDTPKQPPQDLEDLARRYVDLWQDQMTSLAADPDFAESLHKVMAAMGVAASGLPALWSAWPAALAGVMAAAKPASPGGGEAEERQEGDGKSAGAASDGTRKSATAPGSAPAAAAPDGRGPDLVGLAERLAALEQRILALEGGTGGTRRGPKGKPKRN